MIYFWNATRQISKSEISEKIFKQTYFWFKQGRNNRPSELKTQSQPSVVEACIWALLPSRQALCLLLSEAAGQDALGWEVLCLTSPSLASGAVGEGRGCRRMDKSSRNPLVKTTPLQCSGQQHTQCGFCMLEDQSRLIFTTMSQQMSHLQSKPDLETEVGLEFTWDFVYLHFSEAGSWRVGVGWQVWFFTPPHLCRCNVVSSTASQLG